MTGTAALFVQQPEKPRVWETIGAGLRLMGEHPLYLMLPFAIVQVFLIVVAIVTERAPEEGNLPALEVSLVVGGVTSLIGALGIGATVVLVGALRWDQQPSLGDAFNWVFRRIVPLLLLAAFGWFLILPITLGNRMAFDRPALGLAIMAVWLAPYLYLTLRFGISNQLLLLEGHGPIEALRQSWSIMKGYMLRLLGIFLVEGLVGGLIGFGVSFGATAADAPFAATTILTYLVGIPFAVFGVITGTLYFLRIWEIRLATDGAPPEAQEPA